MRAHPRFMSPVPADVDISNAEHGAKMLGLELFEQGRNIARVMEARSAEVDARTGRRLPLYGEVVVQIPRRSTKTTSIQDVLLGRCERIPGYRVVQTAQDGTRASGFFMNMVRSLENRYPDVASRPWTPFKSTGREYIQWANGSRWWVVKPDSGAFRGEAADTIWFDEAGELKPEGSEDLAAGVLPLMDTRPDGQIVISGTPGPARQGLFWDALERGRRGEAGIVDYSAEDGAQLVLDDGTPNVDLWWETHPGLACGLTTLAKMLRNWDKLGPVKFAQEYLCIWSPDNTTSALDLEAFRETVTDPVPYAGQDFDLTFDCHIQGTSASIVATWVDEAGEPCLQVMEHRPGIEWLTLELAKAHKAHPRARIHYDPIGNNAAVALSLQRVPGFKATALHPVNLRETAAGMALLDTHIRQRTLHHAASPSLEVAAEGVTWRYSGDSRLFGRKAANVDVSGIVAGGIGVGQSLGRKDRRRKPLPSVLTG